MFIARCCVLSSLLMLGGATMSLAQDNVKQMPAPGIPVPDADRATLTAGVESLGKAIAELQTSVKPNLRRYLPDVQVYYNAVHYPLKYNEFYNPKEIETAKALLATGMERAEALKEGKAPWTTQTGLVVLGYVSKIDNSVQPYGLMVPANWTPQDKTARRLDFFLHGRHETLTELAFVDQRQRNAGEFNPPGAFVLQPYGRYCNANRFAGEIDVLEALDDARKRYPIDDDRLIMRGFSMGGASCWQFATHHADKWAAAAPGAGFTETPEFLRVNTPDKTRPWYEQKLWHWYDSVDYAANLYQCPTVAYNGDKDGQKQAADKMQEAMEKEDLKLVRIIGPDTGHSYHPDSKRIINAHMDLYAEKGRVKMPSVIHFTTWTLRYNTMNWLTVTGLDQHWERARVDASLTDKTVTLNTKNVSRFSLAPEAADGRTIVIDGQKMMGREFVKDNNHWSVDKRRIEKGYRKTHGLQGPIDDAFLEHFVMVRPTGTPINPKLGEWANSELTRAAREWRAMFRGEALVKDDKDVTKDDIANGNLVLWGDPSSNAVLARIAPKLPVRWDKDGTVRVGDKTYPAGTTVPILIYPNPENPAHYVVINSAITWREGYYYNNDAQYAHLPDWAVIDITTPPNKYTPGRIAAAGFFDEKWQLKSTEEPVAAQTSTK